MFIKKYINIVLIIGMIFGSDINKVIGLNVSDFKKKAGSKSDDFKKTAEAKSDDLKKTAKEVASNLIKEKITPKILFASDKTIDFAREKIKFAMKTFFMSAPGMVKAAFVAAVNDKLADKFPWPMRDMRNRLKPPVEKEIDTIFKDLQILVNKNISEYTQKLKANIEKETNEIIQKLIEQL